MSYAHCALVLSSFNTVDFAQNAEAYDHPRSHEHAHALMLHVGHLDCICTISYYNTQFFAILTTFFSFSSDTLKVFNVRTHYVEFSQVVER